MAHGCPGSVDIPKIKDFPGMPFSRSLMRFRRHYKECETCGVAQKEEPENCEAYCTAGHDLAHEVESDMDFTHAASHWN